MRHWRWICVICCTALSPQSQAQTFGTNLLVNGDGEAAIASGSGAAIPGWTITGPVSMETYASEMAVNANAGDLAPVNRGRNFFAGNTWNHTARPVQMAQVLDLSPTAERIDSVEITCEISAYLGAKSYLAPDGPYGSGAILRWSFLDASGAEIKAAYRSADALVSSGLRHVRTVTIVPPLSRSVRVVVQFLDDGGGFADNVSFSLNIPQLPESILGRNLLLNGDAEAGGSSKPGTLTQDVPGWQREAMSVGQYGDTSGIRAIPPERETGGGAQYFFGVPPRAISQVWQDIDISAAATLVDTGQVTFALSGWLGGVSASDYSYVKIFFNGWSDSLGEAILQGPLLGQSQPSQMLVRATSGKIPAGTRVISLCLSLQAPPGSANVTAFGLADNLSLVLSSTGVPSGSPAVFRVQTANAFGGSSPISPGTWVEIYGANLSTTTREWSGTDFTGDNPPTQLDKTSVTFNHLSVPVAFVSPGQVNAYVPLCCFVNNTPMSTVIVASSLGRSADFIVGVQRSTPGLLAPSTSRIRNNQYAVALHRDGTYVLPRGAIPGVSSRPARPGEVITMYGIGFDAVTPEVDDRIPAKIPSTLAIPAGFRFADTAASVPYSGLSLGAIGLYQFNVVVPAVAPADAVELTVMLGENTLNQRLFTAVE